MLSVPATWVEEEQRADGSRPCGVPVRSVTGRHAGRGIYGAGEKPDAPPGLRITFPAPPLACTRRQRRCNSAPGVLSHPRRVRNNANAQAGSAASPPRRSTRTERTKPRLPGCADGTCAPRETLRGRADAASTSEGFLEGFMCRERWLSRWSEGRTTDTTSEEEPTRVPFFPK